MPNGSWFRTTVFIYIQQNNNILLFKRYFENSKINDPEADQKLISDLNEKYVIKIYISLPTSPSSWKQENYISALYV